MTGSRLGGPFRAIHGVLLFSAWLMTPFLALLAADVGRAEETILKNGDFEQGEIGRTPPEWGRTYWSAAKKPVILTDQDVHSGNRCLVITNDGETWQVAFHRLMGLLPGERYRVTWWAKDDGVAGGRVTVNSYPAGGKQWFSYPPAKKAPDGKGWDYVATKSFSRSTWTLYALEFSVPRKPGLAFVLKLATAGYKRAGAWARYDDAAIEDIGDAPASKPPPWPGNMVTNGGFELGLQDWHSTGDRLTRYEFAVGEADSYHGRFCLRRLGGRKSDVAMARQLRTWSFPSGLISNWFPAQPGATYYLSFAARGSAKTGQTLTVTLRSPGWTGKRPYPSAKVELTDGWQRFEKTMVIPADYAVRKLLLRIDCTGDDFWLDAVRLTVGGPADERLLDDENVGVAVAAERHVFEQGRPASVVLEARNVGQRQRTIRAEYTIRDIFDLIVGRGGFDAKLAGSQTVEHPVTVLTDRRGRFDMTILTFDERNRPIRRTVYHFAVLAPVRSGPESPIATNVHAHRFPTATLRDALTQLGGYGVSWVRLSWGWNLTQLKEEDPMDLSEFDRELEAVEKAGLRPMPCLTLVYWKMKSLDAGDFTHWNRFVEAVVSRYKDRVKLWEVWNEPQMAPREKLQWYVDLVKNTYTVAKRIDPNCRISACSPGDTMNPNVSNSMARIRDFLQMGGVKYCDLIGLHPYASVNGPVWQDLQGSLDRIRGWVSEAGGRQDVLITEAGIYTSQAGYLSDSRNLDAATLMVQDWLIAAVNRTHYFHFAADASPLYGMNLCDPELTPNVIFCAMNALAEQLYGVEDANWLKVNPALGGIHAIGWRRGETHVVALWRVGFPERRMLRLKLVSPEATLTDMFGNNVALQRHEDVLRVSVRAGVAYLALPGIPAEQAAAALARADEEAIEDGTRVEQLVGTVAAGERFLGGYRPPPAEPFAPDADGFIRDWLVMGPFANPGARGASAGFDYDFLKPSGGEANVRLLEGMSEWYQWPDRAKESPGMAGLRVEVKARALHSETPLIDLCHWMPIKQYVVCYANCVARSPKAARARLLVGSDDGIKVWLNGRLVLNRRAYRAAMIDDDKADVSLRAGDNRVLVKVDTDIGGWSFYLRFTDPVGRPLRNLKITW